MHKNIIYDIWGMDHLDNITTWMWQLTLVIRGSNSRTIKANLYGDSMCGSSSLNKILHFWLHIILGDVNYKFWLPFLVIFILLDAQEHQIQFNFICIILYRFDPDNEGSITVQELRYVLSNLPVKVTDEELNAILEAGDTNKDGKISFEEFRDMIGKW